MKKRLKAVRFRMNAVLPVGGEKQRPGREVCRTSPEWATAHRTGAIGREERPIRRRKYRK